MVTEEQARTAAERIAAIDSLDYPESVRTVLHWACQELSSRTTPDDGPITAEWLESIGFVDDDGLYAAVALRLLGQVATVKLLYHRTTSRVRLGGLFIGVYPTRSQLLALLAALRGEPSNNPEQLPHVSRGQLNNLGGGR